MKILMVHNYYQIPGGEDTVVKNEKKLLEDNGHKVILYTRHNNEIRKMNLLQKLCLPIASLFNIRTYKDIRKIIRDEAIDIVHVHNTLHLVSQAVYYASVRSGIPVVQTVHNFRFLCPGATFYRDGHICEDCVSKGFMCAIRHKCYRNNFFQTLISIFNTWIHRQTGILQKIHFICLTEFNKLKLLQLKQISDKQVFVKPNFVFEPLQYSSGERNYYLFVGRIDELKGIKLLFKTWSMMQDKAYELIVCGSGPLYSWCQEFISKHKLANIKMLGNVPHEQIGEYFSKAKALIMCSQWYEGFPMTIVEAYSCKTPVIVGRIGNIKDLVIEGKTGVTFEYDSKVSLQAAVLKMMSMDATQMGINAYNFFQEKYSEQANAKQLMEIYTELIDE